MLASLSYKRKKTLPHRSKRKSYIAQIVLVLLAVELFFLSSFTAFSLPTATAHNWQRYLIRESHKLYCHLPMRWQTYLQLTASDKLGSIISPDMDSIQNLRYSLYVPQAPIAIFVGYILGWPLAIIAAILYVLLGLFGPLVQIYPFTSGSGIHYFLQPGFGYLIGMVVASACVGYISQGNRTSNKQLLSILAGLLSIHGIGLAYMLGIWIFDTIYNTTVGQLPWSAWLFEEARNLSWYALPYDFIFSLALVSMGFSLRWLTTILTAPDIGSNNSTTAEENLVDIRSVVR